MRVSWHVRVREDGGERRQRRGQSGLAPEEAAGLLERDPAAAGQGHSRSRRPVGRRGQGQSRRHAGHRRRRCLQVSGRQRNRARHSRPPGTTHAHMRARTPALCSRLFCHSQALDSQRIYSHPSPTRSISFPPIARTPCFSLSLFFAIKSTIFHNNKAIALARSVSSSFLFLPLGNGGERESVGFLFIHPSFAYLPHSPRAHAHTC